ncbi:MAG: cation-translocating P-type ATPase [Candidatus Nanopelagicaceae bacterium]|jgi:heavy metal translocating P-type ATPase
MSSAPDSGEKHSAEEGELESVKFWRVREFQAAAVSGALLLASWMATKIPSPDWVSLWLAAVALCIAGWTFVPSAWRNLFKGKIGAGTLMMTAALGAVSLGQVEEAATLAFLYSISEGMEEYSLARTRRGLHALLDLVPQQARILRGGVEITVASASLKVGDHMVIRPGERLAADGRILDGETSMDTSAITGESIPIEVGPSTPVYAGFINGTGPLVVEVTCTAENNSLAKIVHIVETEQARKGPSQRLVDSIAKFLVPGIMVAAALIVVYGFLVGQPLFWLHRALVVLVAASPCALAISIPVTAVAAIGAASKIGVLIKGGGALEALGRIRTIAFDKTGTLTRNEPTVVEVIATAGTTNSHLLAVAAGLEARSEHPLARAILGATVDRIAAVDVNTLPGEGIVGIMHGRKIRLGRPGWIDAGVLNEDVTRMQQAGATVVLIEEDGKVVGAIAVRDELRSEANALINRLNEHPYRTVMITGDNKLTAHAIGIAVGVTEVHADLRPEEKAQIIRSLQQREFTAMVGDGVNDAPALATAKIGIAMGAMGSDVAIETADVVLMGKDLTNLGDLFDHARRARRIMLQNVGMSLVLITILIPLALLGIMGLTVVVLAHELFEIVIIGNGVRAGRIRKTHSRVQ